MFKGRTLLLVTLSGLMATGAAWMANNWLDQQSQPPVVVNEVKQAPVVTAAIAIPYGEKVQAQQLKVIYLPEAAVPAGSVQTLEQVEGLLAQQDIIAGEILMQARFTDHLGGSSLAALIQPNMRAVTVRVNDVVGVGGFLLPNNRVDVLATKKHTNRARTETILSDIKVLAVDQTTRTTESDPVIVRAVTLEVTPQQAEVLVKARDEGPIQLTLRNPEDRGVVAKAKPVQRPQRVVKTQASSPSVTIIRGTSSEQTQVKL